MKCTYCGAEVPAGKNFCMWCGTRQTAGESVKMPEPVAMPEQVALEREFPVIKPIAEPVQSVTKPAFEPGFTMDFPQFAPSREQNTEASFSVERKTDSAERVFPEIRPIDKTDIPLPPPRIVPASQKEPDRPRRVPPRLQLPTERGLGKMFFLGILTLGIYPVVIWSRIVTELNIAASRYDGKRTMPYFGMLMLSGITLGIYPLVWMHKFCHRISDELVRRNTDYAFGPSTFWLWGVLGSLILVGPFIFTHKLMKSMNKINAHYNVYG